MSWRPGANESAARRLMWLTALAILHLTVYGTVNFLSARPPLGRYWNFATPVDAWIPYLPWTVGVYYLGDLYIVFWAGIILWQLDQNNFRRALAVYTTVIIVGGTVQVFFPGHAPWPTDFSPLKTTVHRFLHLKPYAVLPSMHVALSVLPAGIALTTLRSTAMKLFTATAAVLIAVSTLTASEHHVLDVVAGALLGWAGWRYWRAGRVAIPQHDGLAVEIGISR